MLALRVRYGALPVTTPDGRIVALCWVTCGSRIVWLGVVDVETPWQRSSTTSGPT